MLRPVDQRLIELLKKDARQSSARLAKYLKVSPSTVRRRLKRLVKSGTVRIAPLVSPPLAGFPVMSVIAFDVGHENLKSAIEELSACHEIKWLAVTTGRFDILATALFQSTDELSSFTLKTLPGIKGLRNSETFICLEVKKGQYTQI